VKVGDLVRVSEAHWHSPGQVGIIINDLFAKGKAFKVLFSDGRIRSKLKKSLEVINEN